MKPGNVFLSLWLAATIVAPAHATDSVVRTLRFEGRNREYRVHRPHRLASDGAPPAVVLALHGGGGSAAAMERLYGLDGYSDRYGMIVVYPDGVKSLVGDFHTWNAGRCCGRAMREKVNDVGFLSAVIDAVVRDEHADPHRVFVTGHSNGAQMAYRLACEIPQKIAAIAPVSGQQSASDCRQSKPVPVLHIHGTLDHCALYQGGQACGGCFARVFHVPGIDSTWPCEGVQESLALRALSYGCSDRTKETRREGPVVCETWEGCPSPAAVTLCSIEGGGHHWQGSALPPACVRRPNGRFCKAWTAEVGPMLDGVDTDQLILDFFSKQ